MFKKINILLLSLVVVVGFCGSVKALTPAQGAQLDNIKKSFASAATPAALATILNNLRSTSNSNGSFWQGIKNTKDAQDALDTGVNNLASVLGRATFSATAANNTMTITDVTLKSAVLSLVADMGSTKLKTQFRLEETAAASQVPGSRTKAKR